GALFARLHFQITPTTFGFGEAVNDLTYVIVGGSFTWLGSPLGALLMTTLPNVFQFLQSARNIVDGIVLLLVILFLPGGLVDLPTRSISTIRGRRAGNTGRQELPGDAGISGTETDRVAPATSGGDSHAGTPLLRLEGVSCFFGGVHALED